MYIDGHEMVLIKRSQIMPGFSHDAMSMMLLSSYVVFSSLIRTVKVGVALTFYIHNLEIVSF